MLRPACAGNLRLLAVGLFLLVGLTVEASAAVPRPGPVGPRARPPGTGGPARPEGQPAWTKFESKEGLFAVEFPGKPKRMPRKEAVMFVVETEAEAYLACYSDLPEGTAVPKEIFDETAKTAFGDGAQVLKSEERTLEGGHPGRALVARDSEGDVYVARWYLVKQRFYQVMVLVPEARKDAPNVARFLDSFTLLDPSKVQAETPPAAKDPATPPAPKPEAEPAKPREPRKPKVAVPDPPADADDVAKALYYLNSGDRGRAKKAAQELVGLKRDPKRCDEVAKALVALLSDPDGFGRNDALKALAVWWTPAVLPDMIKCTQDESFGVRWAAFDALGQVKDPRAAEACAEGLAGKDRGKAAAALKALGPMAETAVLKRLKDPDKDVRVEAIKVIEVIGTRKSLPALKPLTTDKDLSVRGNAEKAVKAISARP